MARHFRTKLLKQNQNYSQFSTCLATKNTIDPHATSFVDDDVRIPKYYADPGAQADPSTNRTSLALRRVGRVNAGTSARLSSAKKPHSVCAVTR